MSCWWECKMARLLCETVLQFLKKLNTELPYGPTIPLLGLYPKEVKVGLRYLYTYAFSSIIHNNQKAETTQVVNWIHKMCYVHIMEY